MRALAALMAGKDVKVRIGTAMYEIPLSSATFTPSQTPCWSYTRSA
jgi:hypothetical protein